MKTCPICETKLFDDMEVCYGCMYSFGSKPELEAKAQGGVPPAREPQAVLPVKAETDVAASARDALDPAAHASTAAAITGEAMPLALLSKAAAALPGWGIRFEMRDETAPHQTWSMELTPPRALA